MNGDIPPLPQYAFMAWCLVKHRDNFTFYLLQKRMIHERKLTFMENFVHVVFMGTRSIWDPSTSWTRCKWTTSLSTVRQQVRCDLFSDVFDFRLQFLVGTVCTTYEIAPKEIIVGIHVRWTWWPGSITTPSALEIDLTGQGYRTQNAGCPRRDSLHVGVHNPPGKMLSPHDHLSNWQLCVPSHHTFLGVADSTS
jgi:hypothetical protein